MITEEDILIVAPANCTAAAKIDIIIAFHFIIAMDSGHAKHFHSKGIVVLLFLILESNWHVQHN